MRSLIRKNCDYLLSGLRGLNRRGASPCSGSEAAPGAGGFPDERNTSAAGRMRGFSGDRSGVVAVLVGLAVPILVGLTAFAVDVSKWSSTKNSLQGTADNAVLSAVMAAAQSGASLTQIQNQAYAVAAAAGYANGQNGVTVIVNNPPLSGPNAGNTSAYEVIIKQPQTRYFSVLLGAAPTVSGRAVALVAGSPACVLATATSGSGAISLINATNVGAKNCTVAANSSSGSAVDLTNASTLTAANLNVVGNYVIANASQVVTPPTIVKVNAPATKDPYANLAVPSFPTAPCLGQISVTNGATPPPIGPGCYAGISVSNSAQLTMSPGNYIINGGGGINVSNSGRLTMGAGIYIINGGSFTLQNATTATATGVSIVLTNNTGNPGNWGTVSFVNATNFTITPPTSGAFQGVAIYMDRNAPFNTEIFSNASSTSLTGTLYFPSQHVNYYNASSVGPACLQLIALTITFANAASFGVNCGTLVVPGLQQTYGPNGKGVPAE